MKILVTGGMGFIGSAVVRLAIARGHEVVNLDALTCAACEANVAEVAGAHGWGRPHDPRLRKDEAARAGAVRPGAGRDFLGRGDVELSDAEACARTIETLAPEAVINAAAYTAVDRAEDEADLAHAVNAEAPGAMARAAAARGIPFVHLSTDYVFDGSGGAPFAPGDPTGMLNTYGRTKLAGEEVVRAAGGTHAILRTSWVFSAHGSNFVKTLLRLSEMRDALDIVEDQIGGPTPAGAIAAACLTIAERLRRAPDLSGTYHLSGAPDTSWKHFAKAIFQAAGRDVAVSGIPSGSYPNPARRPLNSRLDCSATAKAFGIDRPDWREALGPVTQKIMETN